MRRIRRPRLTYANVVASLALFVALGGTGYAAVQLAPNSVGTRQLKRGAVTAAKINARTRRALRGRAGPAGLSGPAGARGPAGANGSNGANGTNGLPGADGAVAVKIGYRDDVVSVPRNKPLFPIINVRPPRPGKYLAIAKLAITPTGSDREITCQLAGNGSSPGGFDVTGVYGDGVEQTITLTYVGAYASPLPDGSWFAVNCTTPAGTSAQVKQPKITLIQANDVSIVPADA